MERGEIVMMVESENKLEECINWNKHMEDTCMKPPYRRRKARGVNNVWNGYENKI